MKLHEKTNQLHLGVYAYSPGKKFCQVRFRFQVGEKEKLPDTVPTSYGKALRVKTIKIPEWFKEAGELPIQTFHSRQSPRIEYYLGKDTVTSEEVFPKTGLKKGELRGFGSFIEKTCLEHLESGFGMTQAKTTGEVQPGRRKQLRTIGLPLNKEVPIKRWISALEDFTTISTYPSYHPKSILARARSFLRSARYFSHLP